MTPATDCLACHPAPSAATHVNGTVNIENLHPSGYADPALHGPQANANATYCGSCHGADYNGGLAPSCNACHEAAGWNATALTTNCTFCHGTKTKPSYSFAATPRLTAPPESVAGATLATDPTVGAHQAHLTTGLFTNGFACNQCHAVPADLSHVNGTKLLQWGSIAAKDTTPTWSGSPGYTCTNYCHGATLVGGQNTAPAWTAESLGTPNCTRCHGSPPNSGQHALHDFYACTRCHSGIASSTAITDKTRHVNGVKNTALSTFGTLIPSTPTQPATCSNIDCHGWPDEVTW
jgi:hypothetical protein